MLGSGSAPAGAKGTRDNEISEPTMETLNGVVNRPGMSGDSSSWKGWGHVRWFIEEVPAGAA